MSKTKASKPSDVAVAGAAADDFTIDPSAELELVKIQVDSLAQDNAALKRRLETLRVNHLRVFAKVKKSLDSVVAAIEGLQKLGDG